MDLGSLFLILALLVLVALFVARPFFEPGSVASDGTIDQLDHELSALLAERDRILNALQELDFDFALGKIPAEDYPAQRTYLVQQGSDVLRRLDALQPGEASQDAEARLEVAIAARRADVTTPEAVTASTAAMRLAEVNGGKPAVGSRGVNLAAAAPDDEMEAMLANRRRSRQEKAVGFCPKCGGPMQKSDRFCPRCGSKIA